MRLFCRIVVLVLTGVLPAVAQTGFPALVADAPAPEYRSQLKLFGQFVGDWKFSGIEYNSDGSRVTDSGEISFRWVLGGRAIQDVWRETSRSDDNVHTYGTTLRTYDPKADVWHITWIDPPNGSLQALTARSIGKEIVLEGTKGKGSSIRWIFSEISANSFRWRGEVLLDGKWKITEECFPHRILPERHDDGN